MKSKIFASTHPGQWLVMVALSLGAVFVSAQRPSLKPAPATVQPNAIGETDETLSPNDASHQSIKMHGHWIIDIKNPDGTIAEHRDFQNSLTTAGQGYLVGLMTGYAIPGDYMVSFGSSGTLPCASSNACAMVRSLTVYPASAYCTSLFFCNATLASSYSLSGTYGMTFTGNITATQSGTVSSVNTYFSTCSNTGGTPANTEMSSPASCLTNTTTVTTNQLTGATITPISVVTGQVIQVEVTFSFS